MTNLMLLNHIEKGKTLQEIKKIDNTVSEDTYHKINRIHLKILVSRVFNKNSI